VLARQNVYNYLNENYISVRIDFDREKDIVQEYGVQGIPDIWFLYSSGEKLTRSTGYVSEDVLISMLKYISEDAFQKMDFKEYLRSKVPDEFMPKPK
jgi:thioredoxin-related protein